MSTPKRDDPLALCAAWLAEAAKSEPDVPTAMALATADASGAPAVRMVLLKEIDDRGIVFYTNCDSRKGRELAANPRASLCLHWKSLGRQVRIDGAVERVDDAEADAYFATRPRDAQIGAWASDQSRPIEGRLGLEKAVAKYVAKFAIGTVPRPLHWSGFRVIAERVEFWRHKPSRLHERVLYARSDGGWGEPAALPLGMATVKTSPLVPARRARLMRAATYASVTVALVLVAMKTAAWLMTDSVAMLSSLADSCIDAVASLVTLFAVRHALTPADREHRFGHGKAEALAGLGQAAFIVASVVFLLVEAGGRLIQPAPVENGTVGIAAMAVAIVLTLGLVQFQRYVVRHTDSVAVAADSLHYKSDLLMNLGVAAALALSVAFGWHTLDPIFAVGVALYILYSAWTILRGSLDLLMDRELPPEERRKIQDIALAHPEVRAAHDLRTRSSGTRVFIQLHLELDGNLTLHLAHKIADEVEAEIKLVFPDTEVMIHQDPAGLVEDQPRFL